MCNVYTVLRNGITYQHPVLNKKTGSTEKKMIVFESARLASAAINMIRLHEENNALVPHIKMHHFGNCEWHCGSFHNKYLYAKDISEFAFDKADIEVLHDTVVIIHLDIDAYNRCTFYGVAHACDI